MRLSDTLTGELIELPGPRAGDGTPTRIGMYVCGPTVYQRAHIGNARPFVVFSWLRSWLRAKGYDVTFVHNITDVNDKIYEAAPGRSAERAREATAWYLEDTSDLGLGMPDELPLATETIPEIVSLIEELVASGHAYQAGSDVYFRVASFPDYGRLRGRRSVRGQDEDEEPNPLKEDPRDFALWKANKPAEDTWWDSPWGRGRPGWHVECSAMAEKFLGSEFWLHGGGLDLRFPHHENERAQSQAAGRPFARVWLHNGLLRFTGEKMSKSLGNVATIREVLDEWGREAALLFFLTAHWRKPIDFSEETMAAAKAQADSFRNLSVAIEINSPLSEWNRFAAALDDDFNTPIALAVLHEWKSRGHISLVTKGLDVFGLGSLTSQVTAPAEIRKLADERLAARATGDYDTADELRIEIEAAGWEIRDIPGAQYQLLPRQ